MDNIILKTHITVKIWSLTEMKLVYSSQSFGLSRSQDRSNESSLSYLPLIQKGVGEWQPLLDLFKPLVARADAIICRLLLSPTRSVEAIHHFLPQCSQHYIPHSLGLNQPNCVFILIDEIQHYPFLMVTMFPMPDLLGWKLCYSE